MTLTTEDLGDVPGVDAATLDAVLEADAFGKFAILSASDEAFIQAGNNWGSGSLCRAFMAATRSEPWLLEYREDGRQFRTGPWVTLDQAREAFRSYLAGGSKWRGVVEWCELDELDKLDESDV